MDRTVNYTTMILRRAFVYLKGSMRNYLRSEILIIDFIVHLIFSLKPVLNMSIICHHERFGKRNKIYFVTKKVLDLLYLRVHF